eukprot:CAMPEP_0183732414 /NCGR_PEP_ID=MMETSP0737-20130205/38413_1 /TAXON_ID=385413 /ORGANISM="Thalassiosira miniscula, Strain CCMP1093" /LENGTH=200 /DNA_ID=CAMNT_0025965427 /DNA_START=1 /DNA_END=603 /DNA_ORIENTATION=-
MSNLPPIDTAEFMSRYYHPKNIAACNANGDSTAGKWATMSTKYSKTKGMYRQKQVDDEIERIRSFKKPSSSKITIIIHGSNLLQVYHHHHHCLDVQLTGGRRGKGRVVWFWKDWETATDERVMKGAIAALDSNWIDPSNSDGGTNTKAAATAVFFRQSAGEKRKRAADAAESRVRGRGGVSQETQRVDMQKRIDVIDLTD